MTKPEYWEVAYEDTINVLKVLPKIAALIYTEKYNKTPLEVTSKDWAGQYANLLGFDCT